MINASGEEEGEESLEDGSHKEKYIEDETGCLMQAEERSHTNKRKLTDHEIVDHSVNFLLAGYETTSNALAYTSYLLALNPEIQEKLQREIKDYFEEKPVSLLLLYMYVCDSCYLMFASFNNLLMYL